MKIAGFLKTSLLEWPAKVASVIFTPGCNFRCPFCHNADLVAPQKIEKLPLVSEKEILTSLQSRRRWIDGVVITGGEPTLQPDLLQFLKKLKKSGFAVMLETNGSQPVVFKKLFHLRLLDYVALDIKAPLDKHYAKAVGLPAGRQGLSKYDPQSIISSIRLLGHARVPFEFRTTVVPGLHDRQALGAMARQLRRLVRLPAGRQGRRKIPWFWQNFQPKNCLDPEFEKIKPYSPVVLGKMLLATRKIYPMAELRQS